jgi:hypothetical protein
VQRFQAEHRRQTPRGRGRIDQLPPQVVVDDFRQQRRRLHTLQHLEARIQAGSTACDRNIDTQNEWIVLTGCFNSQPVEPRLGRIVVRAARPPRQACSRLAHFANRAR